MKKIFLVAFIAFAACNSIPKVEPVKEIPLEEQLSHVDDSVKEITMKLITDSTAVKDTVLKKQFEALSSRRDALKKQIDPAQNDTIKKWCLRPTFVCL